jgi:hypothetical protein
MSAQHSLKSICLLADPRFVRFNVRSLLAASPLPIAPTELSAPYQVPEPETRALFGLGLLKARPLARKGVATVRGASLRSFKSGL